jgi:formylmethanofuran dehydrogenase subunit E-like metal-binding protein
VYLDDGWYYTDVTWDDQDGRKNTDLTSHTFFNLTYQEMSAERDDSQSEIFGEMPKENNTAYNYYVYNNLVIDSPSQFVELLSQAFQKEQNSLVEVRFANRQVYEKVKNGMDEYFNAAAAKAFAVDTINWPQCGYICRDSLLQIEEIIILAK